MSKRDSVKFLLVIFSFFVISPAFAALDNPVIIPQSEGIYEDFYQMAQAGLIKSVPADQFRYAAMSDYEAAGYVVEAMNLYAQAGAPKTSSGMAAKLQKYFAIYRAKAFEIYGKTMEMRKQLKKVEGLVKSPDIKGFDEVLDEAKDTMPDVEEEFKNTTFRGVPPFKVMGMLMARWQDVEAFGIAPAHHTSLGGTVMSLWTEGIVSSDVSFKLNLNFERPANEAEKGDFPEYWGTGQRFLDKYTINLTLWGWQVNTGFFWEDITPFIAKGNLSDRPAFFDRDPYVLEETTKGHFENAFLHSFIKRGDIWSMHGFYGVEFANMALPWGAKFKIMGGKAEKFDERYDKLYLYEFAGRYVQAIDFSVLSGSQVAFNFFNTSNELAEVQTLAPGVPGPNYPVKPFAYLQSATIFGGDAKIKLFNTLSINGEIEMGDLYSYLPKPFDAYPGFYPPKYHQQGPALYLTGILKDLIPVDLELKYTFIDPNYVAQASAVNDTTSRTVNATGKGVEMTWNTYAGDPTLMYNNMSRIDARASIELPAAFGFLNLAYGTASQVTATTNNVFVDHFIFGNRLTGAMWWQLFFSQYGYPVDGRDVGFYSYNAMDHPAIPMKGTGYRYIFTEKWLSNKEMIRSKDPNTSFKETSLKFTTNISAELKLSIHKMLGAMGIQSGNIFLELYGELNSLRPGSDMMPTFDPDTLFSQNLINTFIIWNNTRKSSLMFEYSIERWTTKHSYVAVAPTTITPATPTGFLYANIPIDYFDQSIGAGFDYDFAPRTQIAVRVKKFMHNDLVVKKQSFDGWYLGLELKNFF